MLLLPVRSLKFIVVNAALITTYLIKSASQKQGRASNRNSQVFDFELEFFFVLPRIFF